MKYRIKIITYKNGRQMFYAQVKKRLFWKYILYDGKTSFDGFSGSETREGALNRIDNYLKGNKIIHSIEFEYINK